MTFSAYYKSRMHTLELPTSRVSSPQTPHPCSEMAGLKSFFDRIGVDTGEGFRRHVDEGGHVLAHELGL